MWLHLLLPLLQSQAASATVYLLDVLPSACLPSLPACLPARPPACPPACLPRRRLGWIPLDADQSVEDLDDYAPEPEVHAYLRLRQVQGSRGREGRNNRGLARQPTTAASHSAPRTLPGPQPFLQSGQQHCCLTQQ